MSPSVKIALYPQFIANNHTQDASRETDVFEVDVTEQVQRVEAWVREK
jgi:hypothetical protein